MFIEIFQRNNGFNYSHVAIVDGWKSLIITTNYRTYDTLSLVIPANKENLNIYVPENVILADHLYYYIDKVTADSKEMKIQAKSLLAKANDRIIDNVYTASKSPALIAYDHIHQELISPVNLTDIGSATTLGINRKFDYLTLSTSDGLGLESIKYQTSYSTVSKQIERLCGSYDFGVKETANSIKTVSNNIQFFKGKDLSSQINLSDDFEILINPEYENNTSDEANTAYVYASGEGTARDVRVLNGSNSGIDRKELYVDARDINRKDDNQTLPLGEYVSRLEDRGISKLEEKSAIVTLTGDIAINSKLYTFGRDYNVGDRVTISSKFYNLSKTAIISSAKHTFDTKGEYLELVFDKESPTIFDILNRK